MNLINTFIVWIWLLGIALLIPTALPAGGAKKILIENRENSIKSPLIAFKQFNLLASASDDSFILSKVKVGTPVKLMKVWYSAEDEQWLLVNVLTQAYKHSFYKRGWVKVGFY